MRQRADHGSGHAEKARPQGSERASKSPRAATSTDDTCAGAANAPRAERQVSAAKHHTNQEVTQMFRAPLPKTSLAVARSARDARGARVDRLGQKMEKLAQAGVPHGEWRALEAIRRRGGRPGQLGKRPLAHNDEGEEA
eukprot:7133611-Pyramimonas_sp.AAC.1